MEQLLNYLLHIDTYLIAFVSNYGAWTYFALFLIIFCETGLVVTPFLPGDSLLFTAGTIATMEGNPLNIQVLFLLLTLAAILGNKVNYLIGRAVGPRIFTAKSSWLLNQRHLQEAHIFYQRHGGKTIIIARYLPIIRTFVPFVAGVGYMDLPKFTFYNAISGILWVGTLLFFGYFLGTLPFVQENFTVVIYGIIAISVLPAVFAFFFKKTTQ
jgi:membrane-associated protein